MFARKHSRGFNEAGSAKTLENGVRQRGELVYTHSRARVPLDRMPEEEAEFLRFMPWKSKAGIG